MGKGTNIMKARFPLLLLLGILFLASASLSFGLAYREKEKEITHTEGREESRPEEQPWRRHQGEEEEEEKRDPRKQPRRRHQEQERRGRAEEEEERDPREQPRCHQQTEQEEEQPRREEREQGQRGRGEEEEKEEEPWRQRPQTEREREGEPQRRRKEQGRRGRGEEEGEEEEEREPWRRPQSQREREQEREQRGREKEQEEDEGERRRERRREDPEEREKRRHEESQSEERGQRRERREQRQEREEGSQSQSRRQNNPYHFRSNRFQTRYKNKNGQIRVLQRFDQRSNKLQNLQNYRIVEYESRPNTLILPHHSDAEYILVVLKGRATITVVNPNDRQAYNLERDDALRLPAGTTSYLLNRDDKENLRVVKLAIPVNKPGQFDDFFPSSTQDQQSYLRGFSRKTLEAAFNTRYEEIQRILLEDEEQEQQSQEEGVIVRVSKEQIQELSKHAQSCSRKGKFFESGPFNLRSKPIYFNRFGNFYEITPDKNPQLQDLELSLSSVDINEGALILPHYNSKAVVVVVVDEGKGYLELVGLRGQQQQEQQEKEEEQHEEQQEEENRQVWRYKARLSQGDIFVIPAGYPVSINSSSNLRLLGFGINAENNQRNFLAGEDDNVISQLDKQVKELAFPGSAQDVERLINNQRQSYFANAQPQQKKEGRQRRRGSLPSILSAFY